MRRCALCLRPLPTRWWHRFRLLAPLDLCDDPDECFDYFLVRLAAWRP